MCIAGTLSTGQYRCDYENHPSLSLWEREEGGGTY